MNLRLLCAVAALSALSLVPARAAAPVRDAVMANVARCAGISDDHAWLNCYYGAAQPMRAQLGLAPAPQSQVALVQSAPASTTPSPPPMKKSDGGWFGIGNIFGGSSGKDEFHDAMRLTAYSFTKDGVFTATLADGEVWRQSPYDDLRAHWTGAPGNYLVIVGSDIMGSHTMRVEGDHDYRVIRIK